MTLDQLTDELHEHVRDDHLRDTYFKDWINDAVLGIASDFLLPALKRLEPYNLAVTTTDWLYDLPDAFHKELFKARTADWGVVSILSSIDVLDNVDLDHDTTSTAVSHVAVEVEQKKLAIYPKATTTVRLWFYNLPTVLDLGGDIPTCIPAQYHRRVLIPRVIIDAYPLIQDMAVQVPGPSLGYWRAKYAEGLFGSPKGDIGLIQYLAAQTPLTTNLTEHHLR